MLKARILSALAMAFVLVTVLFALPPIATLLLLSIVVLVGAWEWSAFIRGSATAARIAFVASIALLIGLCWPLVGRAESLEIVLWCAAAWWVIALLWLTLAPQRVAPWSAALAGIAALVPTWLALGHLRLGPEQGAEWTLYALVLVVAADTGAYFCGRAFGRVKLAPRVSPGKTWEGVFGGMLLAAVIGALGVQLFDVPAAVFLPVAIAAAAFSIVGDLTESMLKRAAGVKDSGHLFPGHGGILDRVDSVAAGVPVFVLGLLSSGLLR
jgi:phosphatidate cytidylyltransferase